MEGRRWCRRDPAPDRLHGRICGERAGCPAPPYPLGFGPQFVGSMGCDALSLGRATWVRDVSCPALPPEAFFPLFPLLVRAVTAFGIAPIAAALAINTLALVVACRYLYELGEDSIGAGLGTESSAVPGPVSDGGVPRRTVFRSPLPRWRGSLVPLRPPRTMAASGNRRRRCHGKPAARDLPRRRACGRVCTAEAVLASGGAIRSRGIRDRDRSPSRIRLVPVEHKRKPSLLHDGRAAVVAAYLRRTRRVLQQHHRQHVVGRSTRIRGASGAFASSGGLSNRSARSSR